MHKHRRMFIAAALLAAAPSALAQERHQHMPMPGMAAPQSAPAAPYHPGLGDLMTAFVQPRHIKLGLAGQEHNWAYAAYELDELREAFEEAAKLVPTHGNLVTRDAIGATVEQPMAALGKAIKAKDETGFTSAYAALTQSCNACHQSADHAEIVIRVPSGPAFPDQDFHPQKP